MCVCVMAGDLPCRLEVLLSLDFLSLLPVLLVYQQSIVEKLLRHHPDPCRSCSLIRIDRKTHTSVVLHALTEFKLLFKLPLFLISL